MNTLQQYVDQRNELYAAWHEAQLVVNRNEKMSKSDPQQYALLRTRALFCERQLSTAERLASQMCSEFGLPLRGTHTAKAFIGKTRERQEKNLFGACVMAR